MGLRQDILSEPVSELEWRELLTLTPNDTVRQAVQLMKTKSLGCVVVVGKDGHPVGKFTERDLIALLLLKPQALDEPLGASMSGTWGVVKATDPIALVIECMQERMLRFVIVVDDDGKAIGLTGQKGVIEYIVEHFPLLVKVHTTESKLFMDQREGG